MKEFMEQFTIYGEVEEIHPPKRSNRHFKTMQELYGITKGATCKTCFYLVKKHWDKIYYKCELWKDSNCSSSDIRLKNQACGKYIKGLEVGG